MTVLPDILAHGLDVIICGSAVGTASKKAKAYYAGPGNQFWPTLNEIGITERILEPREYPLLLSCGVGLTDLNKSESGADVELSGQADDGDGLRLKIDGYSPAFLAFNGKRAAESFLGHKVKYGRQPETIGKTAIYVMPSTSGAARRFWDIEPWRELAEHITQRRRFRDEVPADLAQISGEAREDMRASLNRRVYHQIGLDLVKQRPDGERESRMTSLPEAANERALIATTANSFFSNNRDWLATPEATDAVVADFCTLYEQRAVSDNSGGIKFGDSFWLYFLARHLKPEFIVESGSHKGHSSWLLRQACPDAEIHCFDVSFRNLEWRDLSNHYHECDWMDSPMSAPKDATTLCYFDDHISHAQRIHEAHGRGFRTLLLDDDFAASMMHATGHPPTPTLAMIFDDSLEDGQKLEWLRNGKPRSFTIDAAELTAARSLVRRYAKTPDLGPLLRIRPQSGIAVAQLAD